VTALYTERAICYRLSVSLSVCPSVRLSVIRVDQSKTVIVRIMQLSLQSSPILLVFFFISLIQKFRRVPPERGRQTRVDGRASYFLFLCVDISKTVRDTTKDTTND